MYNSKKIDCVNEYKIIKWAKNRLHVKSDGVRPETEDL